MRAQARTNTQDLAVQDDGSKVDENTVYLDEVLIIGNNRDSFNNAIDNIIAQIYSTNYYAQGGRGGIGTANTWNGGFGVLMGAVENLSGNVSIGTNFRFYLSGWGGSQYVSTAKIAQVGKMLGNVTLVAGTALDTKGVYNYYNSGANSPNAVHPGKAGLNLGVGVWGLMNPATATGAALYYGIDTFYPGGFNGAMQNSGSLIQQNQAILGPGWNLYRDY